MPLGDVPPQCLVPALYHAGAHAGAPQMDRPRKPRSNGGPEGPWWRRPVRPE